jgi:four helix bundle protein
MKNNVVKEKSFGFAIRTVALYKFLTNEKKEFILSKQVLRSGTAIGALVREAEQAESIGLSCYTRRIILGIRSLSQFIMILLNYLNYLPASLKPAKETIDNYQLIIVN